MNQRGFTLVEAVVVVAAVVILAGIGFVAYNNFAAPQQIDTAKTAESADHSGDHDMDDMSQVTSTKDLDKAATSLDDASFENDGLSEIDSAASQF